MSSSYLSSSSSSLGIGATTSDNLSDAGKTAFGSENPLASSRSRPAESRKDDGEKKQPSKCFAIAKRMSSRESRWSKSSSGSNEVAKEKRKVPIRRSTSCFCGASGNREKYPCIPER